jgi:hypothetical protein
MLKFILQISSPLSDMLNRFFFFETKILKIEYLRSSMSSSVRPKTTNDKRLKNSKPYTPIYSTLLSKSEAPLMDRYIL